MQRSRATAGRWLLAAIALLGWLPATAAASAPVVGAAPSANSTDLGTAALQSTRQMTPAAARRAVVAGIEGSVWGSPALVMAATRARLLCLTSVNTFVDQPGLANPSSRLVVTPNVDTLYSSAWLDLRRGPVLLHVPAVNDRYYVLQLLDLYTNTFADIGTRSTGTAAATYAVVGPNWHGRTPPGAHRIAAPTPDVWIIGRTLVRSQDDQSAAAAVQQGFVLEPSHPNSTAVGTPELPGGASCSAALASPPPSEPSFFHELAAVMAADPPPARDAPILHDLAAAGIRPGGSIAVQPPVAPLLTEGAGIASILVNRFAATSLRSMHGWSQLPNVGNYGRDYFARAIAAERVLGANVPKESVYFSASVDQVGSPLTGTRSYVLHFPPKGDPPITPAGFWSVTLYGPDHFLVANPERRYAIGDRTPALVRDADGSLDILIGGQPAPDRPQNWLPAPPGPFNLVLRAYLPATALQTNRWIPPGLQPSG